MNVYVESNFVLELALLQEQHAACEAIVQLCEAGDLRLVLPAYCSRLLSSTDLVPLESSILTQATIYQERHGLSVQDSVVYAFQYIRRPLSAGAVS